ncbi:MAG: hypothetical protein IPQ08_12880 [Chitinophagaceae bacterium]|nr:hypothetical protein [Chitinophagaceae bacterium]
MDQQDQLFGLSIDPQSKRFLAETAKWGRFLAIIGFIACIGIALLGVYFATQLSNASSISREYGGGAMANLGPAIAVVYILFAVLYFFPCLYLLRFSSQMGAALHSDDQATMTSAFENLKSVFKFFGILTIIVLAIYILSFLIVMLSAG